MAKLTLRSGNFTNFKDQDEELLISNDGDEVIEKAYSKLRKSEYKIHQ